MSWDVATTESKAIVTVKNNGDVPAEFVQCTAIFYYDGEIIGHTNKFCIDNDSEIKPGSSISEELSSYEPFTDVKIFVTGRT